MTELKIYTEFIKLKDALKFGAYAENGAQAKLLVAAGSVKVNGEKCFVPGRKLFPGDTFYIDGLTVQIVL